LRRRLGWIALGLVLFWMVGYPLLLTLVESLGAPGWTLANYAEFVRRPAEWHALWASLWISVATVVLSAAVGVPLAFLFERTEFPGRRALGTLVALPVALPPLIGVLAFLFLYGESGFASRAVQAALRLDRAPWRLTGPAAILFVHAYSMYVYFYLFTRAGLARLDGAYLEAAATSIAMRGKVERGGRTMLDALDPAAEALRVAARRGASPDETAEAAARAAEAGAVATAAMAPTVGRAAWLADRARGHEDAGARFVAMAMEAAAAAVRGRRST